MFQNTDMWGIFKTQKTKRVKLDKQEYIKLRNFYTTKEIINTLKVNPMEQEEYLQTVHLKRINILSRILAV